MFQFKNFTTRSELNADQRLIFLNQGQQMNVDRKKTTNRTDSKENTKLANIKKIVQHYNKCRTYEQVDAETRQYMIYIILNFRIVKKHGTTDIENRMLRQEQESLSVYFYQYLEKYAKQCLNIDAQEFNGIWNESLLRNIDNNNKEQKVKKGIIDVRKYWNHYCTICGIFVCNLHPIYGSNSQQNQKFYHRVFKNGKSQKIREIKCPTDLGNQCCRNYSNEQLWERPQLQDTVSTEIKLLLVEMIRMNIKVNSCYLKKIVNDSYVLCLSIQSFYSFSKECKYHRDLTNEQVEVAIDSIQQSQPFSSNFYNKSHKYYKPCYHEGECSKKNNCECIKNDMCCEKYCGCFGFCNKQFMGCQCLSGQCSDKKKIKNTNSVSCICIQNKRDCDPDLCKLCKSSKQLSMINRNNIGGKMQECYIDYCPNTVVYYQNYNLHYELKRSNFCDGMGMYANRVLKSMDQIGEYVGVYIDGTQEYLSRFILYEYLDKYYIFTLAQEQINIDSTYYGNETRFINHNVRQLSNVDIRTTFVKGILRIVFQLKNDVHKGDELTFEYGDDFTLPWIKEFRKMMAAVMKAKRNVPQFTRSIKPVFNKSK